MYTVVATFLGSRRYCFSIIVFDNTPVYFTKLLLEIQKRVNRHIFTLHGHPLTGS
jgi:hypothetical protein